MHLFVMAGSRIAPGGRLSDKTRDRQADSRRPIVRQTDSSRSTVADRQSGTPTVRHTYSQADRQSQAYRRQIDSRRPTVRQTDSQADR